MYKITQYLTIIIYHYIRDLPNTHYPDIKGLLTSKFIGQLDYLQKYYNIISMEDCINAYLNKNKLPPNACLLTFDDGFIDHYTNAFPILMKKGLTGAFFPPAKAIQEEVLLDIHKIHFILANTKDYKQLVNEIFDLIDIYKESDDLPNREELISKFTIQSRWNPPEIIFIKQLLQHGLPKKLRKSICSELFKEFVTKNEDVFSKELYMSIDQLKLMIESGMYIGGHGYSHDWLGMLSKEMQINEIMKTYEFLKMLYDKPPMNWVMSYPRSSKNETTISILKEYNCTLGLTTIPELAIVDSNSKFDIPRLDTNDFPHSPTAKINKWTKLIIDSNKKAHIKNK